MSLTNKLNFTNIKGAKMDKIIVLLTGTENGFNPEKRVIVAKNGEIITEEKIVGFENSMYLAEMLSTSLEKLGFKVKYLIDIYDPIRDVFDELLSHNYVNDVILKCDWENVEKVCKIKKYNLQ